MRLALRFFSTVWLELCALTIIAVGLVGVVGPQCLNARDDGLFWVAVFAYVSAPIMVAVGAVCIWSEWRRFRLKHHQESTQ